MAELRRGIAQLPIIVCINNRVMQLHYLTQPRDPPSFLDSTHTLIELGHTTC